MTKEFDAVQAALARLKADVAAEIKQLADALASADNPVDIQTVADGMNELAANLEADDPPAPEPTP